MKITVYLKNGAFVNGEVTSNGVDFWKRNWGKIELIHLKNPNSTVVVSEITHIIEQPNQTENT